MANEELLASWNDTATRQRIVDFVARVTADGPDFVAPADRVATFDNDGTLWCEKPLPIQLAFILQQLAKQATNDESLQSKQPWKAAYTHDLEWLGGVITKHYAGDDSDVKVLMGGILGAFAGVTVDEYGASRRQLRPRYDPPEQRPALPGLRIPADGRAVALPRGQRLRHVHRVRR